jgi:hypothetical protein
VVHCVEQQWPELRPAVVFSAASPGCLKAHGGSMTIAQIDRGVTPEGPTVSARHEVGRARVIWSGHAVALLRDLLVVVLVAMAILLLLPAALAAQAAVAV